VRLDSPRLILRRLTDDDRPVIAAMNADPVVMEYIGPLLTPEESDTQFDRIQSAWTMNGFGIFGAELRDTHELIGWIGIGRPQPYLPIAPRVEIGWRLARAHWGLGLASEGARVVRRWGHDELGIDEIVAITARVNLRSQRVMDKIGLVRDLEGDFDHPNVPEGSQLRAHVLYRGFARDPH
jgi:ribosomal-protein-alanine N-acetyltransferase